MLGSVLKDLKHSDDQSANVQKGQGDKTQIKQYDTSSDEYTDKSVKSDDTNKKWKKETLQEKQTREIKEEKVKTYR